MDDKSAFRTRGNPHGSVTWTAGSELLPQPRTIAMEATTFTGWIYDHLLPPLQFIPLSRHRLSSSVSSCIS
jgi:hypothetical protein